MEILMLIGGAGLGLCFALWVIPVIGELIQTHQEEEPWQVLELFADIVFRFLTLVGILALYITA